MKSIIEIFDPLAESIDSIIKSHEEKIESKYFSPRDTETVRLYKDILKLLYKNLNEKIQEAHELYGGKNGQDKENKQAYKA